MTGESGDKFDVFISAVSSEFETVRSEIAHDLMRRASRIRWQETFRQEVGAHTLLELLHDYVKQCEAVICVVGNRSGDKPDLDSVPDRFREMLPAGTAEASYTQWEYFFALHYRKRRSVYRPVKGWNAERPDGPGSLDIPGLQAAFVKHLDAANVHWSGFETAEKLRIAVLHEDWPDARPEQKPDNVPFQSIGDLFTGREEFLRDIRASLTRENGGASAIVSSVCGMGGVGKTRAAVEYALRHRDDYTALLFVRANDEQTLTTELAALTGVLRLPESEATETDIRRVAALRWLAEHRGWLLILDNVDTPAAVRTADEIVRTLRGGHVLLTSRLDDAFRHGIEPLDLGLLSLDDAVAYLLKATAGRRRREPDAEAQARALAEALDRLTLGLVHAGAYISERRLGFAAYLAEWNGNRGRVLEWAKPEKTGYPMSLAQTWLTSMEQLTPAGRALLERLSFFANDPVPESLLDVPLRGSAAAEGLEPLLGLQRFSLIIRDAEAERFTVHRIVRDVTYRRLATDPGAHKSRLIEALGWIDTAFAGDPQDARTWPVLEPLAQHAEALAREADETGIANPTTRLMSSLGTLLQYKAQFSRAEPLKRRALAIDEASLGVDHPNVAIHLNNIAQLLQATNRLAEAEPMMRRALAIDEASLGAGHPNVAVDLNNLAALLLATNRLAEAEPLMRRMVVIFLAFQRNTGHPHPHRDTVIQNYAHLLSAMGRDAAAIGEAIADAHREAGLD